MTASSLDKLRLSFSMPMIALQWVMVLVVAGVAALNGQVSPFLLTLPTVALAASATFAWRLDPVGDWTRWLTTVGLCGQVAVLVYAAAHSTYQIDMHMAFFAALAVAAGWACMTSILLGTTLVAVHHLVLSFLYPLAVFPESASVSRVLVHAAILLVEAGALILLCRRVVAALEASDGATRAAKRSEQEVRSLGEERTSLQADVQASHTRAEERILAVVGNVVAAAREGDFSRRAAVSAELGRLGTLVEGMNEINASVDRATAEFLDVLAAVSQGDLTTIVATSYSGRFGDLGSAINRTVEKLSETVTTIQSTAQDVGASAHEIQAGADDLSRRTEEQASSLEETAATTEELAASVKASAHSSRNAVDLAEQAMKVAVGGGGIVREAVEAMARIEQASQKISDISSVIDEIAFQTNLLALNAAVEAARAGEAGKGFAVVASEVRTLAQRSSDASKDITGLITTSNAEVAQGVRLVRSAGDALADIVNASQKVSATVSEISLASGEQANGIDEMSQALAHIDGMTQQNAAMAEESAASAKSLTVQVEQLNELVALFRTRGAARPTLRDQAARPARPPQAEPHRLRQLAADAFKAKPPKKAAAAAAGRAAKTSGGWDEF